MIGVEIFFFFAIAIAISAGKTQNDLVGTSSSNDLHYSVGDLAQNLGVSNDDNLTSENPLTSACNEEGSNAVDETLTENLSRPIYSRQTPGSMCNPKSHMPDSQSNEQHNPFSNKQPEANPSRGNIPYVPRGPCDTYEDQNILLTCAGPESVHRGLLMVARCVPGKIKSKP